MALTGIPSMAVLLQGRSHALVRKGEVAAGGRLIQQLLLHGSLIPQLVSPLPCFTLAVLLPPYSRRVAVKSRSGGQVGGEIYLSHSKPLQALEREVAAQPL